MCFFVLGFSTGCSHVIFYSSKGASFIFEGCFFLQEGVFNIPNVFLGFSTGYSKAVFLQGVFQIYKSVITSKVFTLVPWYLVDMICMAFWINGENNKSIATVIHEWFQLLQNQAHFKIRKIVKLLPLFAMHCRLSSGIFWGTMQKMGIVVGFFFWW